MKEAWKQSDQLLYGTEDTSIGRNLEHSSSSVNVYLPQGHLGPLLFWSWLLQINLLIIIPIVLVVFLIIIVVAVILTSGTLIPLNRLWENLVGDGNTQL